MVTELRIVDLPITSLEHLPDQVETLYLTDLPLTSLEHLPRHLQELHLDHIPLQNLHSFPGDIQDFQMLFIHTSPELRTMSGLPNPFRGVKGIYLQRTGMQTLEDFPSLPNIERIEIKHGYIPNYAGLETLLEDLPGDYALHLYNQPIISPYGISPERELQNEKLQNEKF